MIKLLEKMVIWIVFWFVLDYKSYFTFAADTIYCVLIYTLSFICAQIEKSYRGIFTATLTYRLILREITSFFLGTNGKTIIRTLTRTNNNKIERRSRAQGGKWLWLVQSTRVRFIFMKIGIKSGQRGRVGPTRPHARPFTAYRFLGELSAASEILQWS